MIAMAPEKKLGLYAEIPASLKERLQALADRNDRKLVAELVRALKRYLKEEEEKIKDEDSDT